MLLERKWYNQTFKENKYPVINLFPEKNCCFQVFQQQLEFFLIILITSFQSKQSQYIALIAQLNMDMINNANFDSRPTRVDFFYVKPLFKQQQQVELPQYQKGNDKLAKISLFTYASNQISSLNSEQNKPNHHLPSDILSVKSSQLTFQQIKRKYLDDYLFLSNLGKGAYGRVEKLKNKLNGNIYAGKILLKGYHASTNKYKNKKLQKQIKIYSKVYHPNIPELYEIYYWKNQYTLIMEYVKGQNLHSVLNNHPNQQKKIAKIIFQILDVLEYLHSMKIVHHDIKPQNIIYDQETQIVKIVDFGQSIQLKSQSEIIERQGGTYAYFAPQYFLNICSPKLDIWACGVVLYYLLEKKVYFNDARKQNIKRNILSKQMVFQGYNWSFRSQNVKDLILKMVEKDPSKRISASQAKKHKWIEENCLGWYNPSKNILKNSIKSCNSYKRNLSQNYQGKQNLSSLRKVSCDFLNKSRGLSQKKSSRFCKNQGDRSLFLRN